MWRFKYTRVLDANGKLIKRNGVAECQSSQIIGMARGLWLQTWRHGHQVREAIDIDTNLPVIVPVEYAEAIAWDDWH